MDPSAPGGSSDFQQELLALWQDPQVRSLALKWVGDPHLAEDVRQAAYYGLAALEHPERIENLRAYFLRALKNAATHLYTQRRAAPTDDPGRALDPAHSGTAVCGPAPARPIDETVCASMQGQSWLERLAANRDCLLVAVPARSADPGYYRAVIYTAAEQVLRDGINGEPSDADSNDAFRAAYPEYFNQLSAGPNTLHQRFRRAREDVKALLRAVVRRDELR